MYKKTKSFYGAFTKQNQISKTLRFQLELVEESQKKLFTDALATDKGRKPEEILVKTAIDDFFRWLLQKALNNRTDDECAQEILYDWNPLAKSIQSKPEAKKSKKSRAREQSEEDLQEEQAAQKKKIDAAIEELQKKARVTLQNRIESTLADFEKRYCHPDKGIKLEKLSPNSLLKTILPAFNENIAALTQEQLRAIEAYSDYSTQLRGFMQNRKNVYSKDDISTSILHRIVNVNFPKHLKNIGVFQSIPKTKRAEWQEKLGENFQDELQNLEINTLSEAFTVNFYNKLLTQKQVENYNTLLGGKTDGGNHLKGLNGYINEYNQRQNNKTDKISRFVPLHKMILAHVDSHSDVPIAFSDVVEMCNAIVKMYDDKKDCFNLVRAMVANMPQYNLTKVYINAKRINSLSHNIFGDFAFIQRALENYYDNTIYPDYQKNVENANVTTRNRMTSERKKWLEATSFPLSMLEDAISAYRSSLDETAKTEIKVNFESLIGYFSTFSFFDNKEDLNNSPADISDRIVENQESQPFDIIIQTRFENIQPILEGTEEQIKDCWANNENKGKFINNLKAFLDAINEVIWFIKPFYLDMDEKAEKDPGFYNQFDALYEELCSLLQLYDRVRNFVTRKVGQTGKMNVCFGITGNFLGGWVCSKTDNSFNGTQYKGYLFRKQNSCGEYDYFLGVSNNTKLFDREKSKQITDPSQYELLDYYQQKSQNVYNMAKDGETSYSNLKVEMLNYFNQQIQPNDSNDLYNKIQQERGKNNSRIALPSGYLEFIKENAPDFYSELLQDSEFQRINVKIIDLMKRTLATLTRMPAAIESSQKTYNLFTELKKEIDEICNYPTMSYIPISQAELSVAMSDEKKPLLLFKITNKDLSYAQTAAQGLRKKGRGRDNLHTMYLKQLFSGQQDTFDLGTGMIFHRDQVIRYDAKTLQRGHHANELKGKFNYPIIKDRRFTKDTLLFHLSISINPSKKTNNKQFNQNVLKTIVENKSAVKIIGLDRGETNLVYMTMIDQNGNIVKQKSFNVIEEGINSTSGKVHRTDYQAKLTQRQEENKRSRQSWETCNKIKDLKEGYISQVVHEIVTLMVENNAIVVMENLNFGFKQGRFHVEKQVYQKFEKALIDKLNYLVFKDRPSNEPGGVLNGYQLTPTVAQYKDMGDQCGFLFYVPAKYTSKIDPATGFVSLIYPKYESVAKARTFLEKFDRISYNPEKGYFEFTFNYDMFPLNETPWKTVWTICTYGDKRINPYRDRTTGAWMTEDVDVSAKLKALFKKFGIDYQSGNEFLSTILSQDSAAFFKELLGLLSLTLQLRHRNAQNGDDFILSPVCNASGEFFDSRKYQAIANSKQTPPLPQDADANGAYNIALKGLWLLERGIEIKNDKISLTMISNADWFQFACERNEKK